MPSPSGKPRFLIGNGERLTQTEKFISSPKPEKLPAYTLSEAATRLAPRLGQTVRSVSSLPAMARPRGEAIALVTLHPEFLAKTLFRHRSLQALDYVPLAAVRGVSPRRSGRRSISLWLMNPKPLNSTSPVPPKALSVGPTCWNLARSIFAVPTSWLALKMFGHWNHWMTKAECAFHKYPLKRYYSKHPSTFRERRTE
jgi:hypothetical protein